MKIRPHSSGHKSLKFWFSFSCLGIKTIFKSLMPLPQGISMAVYLLESTILRSYLGCKNYCQKFYERYYRVDWIFMPMYTLKKLPQRAFSKNWWKYTLFFQLKKVKFAITPKKFFAAFGGESIIYDYSTSKHPKKVFTHRLLRGGG